MKILLDSNAYSALMRGHTEVTQHVRQAERVILSAIVAGELIHGFRYGSRYEENRQLFQDFLRNDHVSFVPVTLGTADLFGRIATSLREKGRPIPTNDMWIAAHAMETGANLISEDGHFKEIDGLFWIKLSFS